MKSSLQAMANNPYLQEASSLSIEFLSSRMGERLSHITTLLSDTLFGRWDREGPPRPQTSGPSGKAINVSTSTGGQVTLPASAPQSQQSPTTTTEQSTLGVGIDPYSLCLECRQPAVKGGHLPNCSNEGEHRPFTTTTNQDKNHKPYCSNCREEGHYFGQCRKRRRVPKKSETTPLAFWENSEPQHKRHKPRK
ncbi:hypothetical protein FRC03_001024 [Tulasnella sp. 419]|nr:hypothetical protein FRC03_001024 [Tulasnella sp. 419]